MVDKETVFENIAKNIAVMSAIAFPVGLVVVALGLIMITGDPINAGTLVLYSIVCTLGISLLIWVPLVWLAGFITVGIILGIAQAVGFGLNLTLPGQSQSIGEVFQPAVSRATVKQQSLVNYIRKAQAKGFSESQIQNRLRQEGWSLAEIEQAQGAIETSA